MTTASHPLCHLDRPLALLTLLFALASPEWGFAQSDSRALFRGGTPFSVSAPASAVVLADFDGDGGVDIAVCHESTGEVSVIPVRRDGVLGTPMVYAVGAAPVFISAGDLGDHPG